MNGKRVTGMILAGAVAASLFGSAPAFAEEPVTVTGIFGEEEIDVTFEKAPERVVSLAGFATEMLLALGLEDRIVGYAWQDNDVLPQYQEAFEKCLWFVDGVKKKPENREKRTQADGRGAGFSVHRGSRKSRLG